MSAEFVDTNIFVYAHDATAGDKREKARELLQDLTESGRGALSTQVLSEFYIVATKKLAIPAREAEEILEDLGTWILHRPAHSDLVSASRLHRLQKIAWWDALILNSAIQLKCSTLWSEDFASGRKHGELVCKNPFA